MFRPLKGHYQGVRTVTDTCTYRHTYNTSVLIQCEVIYDSTGVRDVNFMLSKVEVFEVYTYLYSSAKSMMTVFPWLYKFTSMPFGCVCVQISRALKLLHIYVLALYAAWFRNYLQFSSVSNIIRM
jgi:hypothetical protein